MPPAPGSRSGRGSKVARELLLERPRLAAARTLFWIVTCGRQGARSCGISRP